MKGLKVFLIGLGLFVLVSMAIVIIVGIQQGKQKQAQQIDLEKMSIDEVRQQAATR